MIGDIFEQLSRTMYVDYSVLTPELRKVLLKHGVFLVSAAVSVDEPDLDRIRVMEEPGTKRIVFWCPVCTALVLDAKLHMEKGHPE